MAHKVLHVDFVDDAGFGRLSGRVRVAVSDGRVARMSRFGALHGGCGYLFHFVVFGGIVEFLALLSAAPSEFTDVFQIFLAGFVDFVVIVVCLGSGSPFLLGGCRHGDCWRRQLGGSRCSDV